MNVLREKATSTPLPDWVKIRTAVPKDADFVRSSWVASNIESARLKKGRSFEVRSYRIRQHEIVNDIVHRGLVVVACNPDDPYHIYGYIVYDEEPTIHYVYVKSMCRGSGIARALVKIALADATRCFVTHMNHRLRRLLDGLGVSYECKEIG